MLNPFRMKTLSLTLLLFSLSHFTNATTIPASTTSTVTCQMDAIDPGAPADITDDCGQTVSPVLLGSTNAPVCEGDVIWTYVYTDCNDQTYYWTHTYTIDNTIALTAPASTTSTVTCPADVVDPGAPPYISDACGRTVSAILVGNVDTPDPITCEGTSVWTYEYTDCSGNTATWTHTYVIEMSSNLIVPSNTSSIINNPSDGNNQPAEPGMILDVCGNIVSPIITAPSIIDCEGEMIWEFTYIDCAGNTATYTHTYILNYSTVSITDPIDNSVSFNGSSISANASGYQYQWVDCANNFSPIQGEQNQSFNPTENGTYAVKIISPSCTVTSQQTTVNSIGLDEISSNLNYSIYPNPTSGTFTIDFGEEKSEIHISIFTINGQLITQQDYYHTSAVQSNFDAPNGVYLIEIRNENNQLAREKIYKY